jgi:hypothetical protein
MRTTYTTSAAADSFISCRPPGAEFRAYDKAKQRCCRLATGESRRARPVAAVPRASPRDYGYAQARTPPSIAALACGGAWRLNKQKRLLVLFPDASLT